MLKSEIENQRIVDFFEKELEPFYVEVEGIAEARYVIESDDEYVCVGTVCYFKGDDENRAFVSIEQIANNGRYTYALLIKVGNEYIPVSDVANIYDRKGPQNTENPLATLLCERGIEPFQTAQSLGEDWKMLSDIFSRPNSEI